MIRSVLVGVVSAALLGPASPAGAVVGDWVPAPSGVIIEVGSVAGSGCSPDTTEVSMSPDSSTFTVEFSAFYALIGVGAKPTDFRKNCSIALKVHVPSGFSYGLMQSEYYGHLSLARGATGVQRASYYFSGTAPTAMATHSFSGPVEDAWQSTDIPDVASMVFSPCDRDLWFTINMEVRVNAGTSNTATTTSFMALDRAGGDGFKLAWRTCE